MADLRACVEGLGFQDVRTHINSGNLVFSGPGVEPGEVRGQLELALEETFGFPVDVVVRTRDELAAVVAADPLGEVASDPSRYHVSFLAETLDRSRVAHLDPKAYAPEAFHLDDREVYVWAPEGARDSRLLDALSEKKLGTTVTARNWRTVTKLLELADELG